MNADEIVGRLREYAKRCDGVHACWNEPTLTAAADLIESLQAQLADMERHEKYLDSIIESDEQICKDVVDQNSKLTNDLRKIRTELAASQRRERAAVEDLRQFRCRTCYMGSKKHLSDGQMDGVCITCQTNYSYCNWQWRGPQEAGERESHE